MKKSSLQDLEIQRYFSFFNEALVGVPLAKQKNDLNRISRKG